MEIWKPVVGFESFYEVSNLGRVKSLQRIIVKVDGTEMEISEKILNPSFHKGYMRVYLSGSGGRASKLVHNLVAQAFPHTTKIMGKAESATTGDKLVKKLEKIVEERQYQKIDGQIVDLSTASAILKVIEHLREKKPESLEKFINMSINQMAKISLMAVGSKASYWG